MTLTDPPQFNPTPYAFAQAVSFPQVLALPHRDALPDGDVLTFRFPNGYGAVITRAAGVPPEAAFEFGVLDCTFDQPRLTVQPSVCGAVVQGAAYDVVAQLLQAAERLPCHPAWERALVALEDEEF
ncbi:hypothetical protein HNQ07_000013 [Deinococcus metalli]|uniref:Uncharacterized protein n=1 Tax=Deinococcus metalli TaxID=1141878 RepID=A0A7W8NLC2_9DEIO|nr:hypothetical protein [Deinococcus metalli]MBB5374569.1 hypothetical protein [Deinococcus metalli]GHF35299.1 hypothetical protein GCM10017781_10270 [Deinococcus metalli]